MYAQQKRGAECDDIILIPASTIRLFSPNQIYLNQINFQGNFPILRNLREWTIYS